MDELLYRMGEVKMPSKQVTLTTAFALLGTVPITDLGYIKGIEYDNDTASDVLLTIQDTFTPNPSNGVSSPVSTSETRKTITLPANSSDKLEWDKGEIPILAACQVKGSVSGPEVLVNIEYN